VQPAAKPKAVTREWTVELKKRFEEGEMLKQAFPEAGQSSVHSFEN
jgi:hypothetical protein